MTRWCSSAERHYQPTHIILSNFLFLVDLQETLAQNGRFEENIHFRTPPEQEVMRSCHGIGKRAHTITDPPVTFFMKTVGRLLTKSLAPNLTTVPR